LLHFLDGMAHWLFEVDIFALIHRIESDARVPVIRGRDNDCVYARHCERLSIIKKAFYAVLFSGLAPALFVDVAYRNKLAGVVVLVAELLKGCRIGAPSPAAANDGDVDAIVRSQHAGAVDFGTGQFARTSGHRFSSEHDTRAQGAGLPDKIPPIKIFGHANVLS